MSIHYFHPFEHKRHRKSKGKNYSWLKEYEVEEKEAFKKTSAKLTDRIVCSQELGIPNMTELVRMAYVDKFQFRTLDAYRSDVTPLKLLLPLLYKYSF